MTYLNQCTLPNGFKQGDVIPCLILCDLLSIRFIIYRLVITFLIVSHYVDNLILVCPSNHYLQRYIYNPFYTKKYKGLCNAKKVPCVPVCTCSRSLPNMYHVYLFVHALDHYLICTMCTCLYMP